MAYDANAKGVLQRHRAIMTLQSALPDDYAGLSWLVEAYFSALAAAALAALTAAQRFLVASMILLRPSALSLLLPFLAAAFDGGAGDPDSFLASAQRFFCASAIRFLPAALILRRLRPGAGVATGAGLSPDKCCRNSAMRSSNRCFWAS
jgi:hypothetical protein